MLTVGSKENSMILAVTAILMLLLESVDSSEESFTSIHTPKISQPGPFKLTPQLCFQIKLHAFLLWASVGFLMPVGILTIRISHRLECGKKLKILFYSHVILQIVAVLLATAGAVLSIKNFENSFSNTHQRIGLALYALLWIQPLIGFFKPNRGVKLRSLWFFIQWLLGTGVALAGIINVYIGLHAYHARTSRSVNLWISLFTLEVMIIAFVYLFQDRWAYMKKQGVILGQEQIMPSDHVTPPRINNEKKLGVLFQMVETQQFESK